MEGSQLAAELAAAPLPDFAAGPPETEAVVAGLGAATAPAVAAVLAAAERASQLTGMSWVGCEWFARSTCMIFHVNHRQNPHATASLSRAVMLYCARAQRAGGGSHC